ncbi:hypothetical protein KUV86_08540 [Halomonas sp. DP8Y7-3]|uniref:hypothetical protein n=1 Tax=Halomonas sp. DP8Y7-3 TaxID=2859079 RepID=UPI001C978A3A|nr:hypothetical protein [Halomonas sp. DP8Y7-3]MBY5929158.1 hypothetical protein [Halomonas sp. DP8Y7-3]
MDDRVAEQAEHEVYSALMANWLIGTGILIIVVALWIVLSAHPYVVQQISWWPVFLSMLATFGQGIRYAMVPYARFGKESFDVRSSSGLISGVRTIPYAGVDDYTIQGKKVVIRGRSEKQGREISHEVRLSCSGLGERQHQKFLALLDQHLGPAKT